MGWEATVYASTATSTTATSSGQGGPSRTPPQLRAAHQAPTDGARKSRFLERWDTSCSILQTLMLGRGR